MKVLTLDGLQYYNEIIRTQIGAYIQESIYGLVDGTIENVSNSKATYVRDYGFYQHQSLITAEFPNVISIGNYAFYRCPNLVTINADLVTNIGSFAFRECSSLTSVDFPVATAIGDGAFNECNAISSVSLPLLETVGALMFRQCEALTSISLPMVTTIKTQAFWSSGIESLTLESNVICTLESADAFYHTPIEEGVGYIYVPSSLVDSYKTAENWSVYANQIQAIV